MKADGRRPKPNALKLIQGTFRPTRGPNQEAKAEPAIPDPPRHLGEESLKEWERVSQELYTLGLLSKIDRAALAAYCDCWADYVDASSRVKTMGLVVTTKTITQPDGHVTGGNIIENPYYSIKKRSLEIMYRYLTEFGMTPASRSRIEANPPGDAATPGTRWKGFA